jgi:hypothetical protein
MDVDRANNPRDVSRVLTVVGSNTLLELALELFSVLHKHILERRPQHMAPLVLLSIIKMRHQHLSTAPVKKGLALACLRRSMTACPLGYDVDFNIGK